jgi:signal transduction histidine kinase
MGWQGEPACGGYRGRDRRAVARGVAVHGRPLLRWTVVGAATAMVLVTSVVLLAPGPHIDLWPLTLAFWCTVTLGSGIALLISWRIGGWARPGQMGTALVALAGVVSIIPRLAELTAVAGSHVRPVATTVVLVAAITQLVLSLHRDDVDTTVRPVRQLTSLIGLMVVCLLAGSTVLLMLPARLDDAVVFAPGAVCLVGATLCVTIGRRAPRPVTATIAGALALMGLGSFSHQLSSADPWQVLAAVSMCTSCWGFAGLARVRLRAALRMADARSLQTLATLGQYSSEVSAERERRHDALNALAAIRSASDVLTSQGQDLDAATRAELSLAARDELARVERMLSPDRGLVATDVALMEVLRPVLLARKHTGLDVDCQLDGVRVHAVPDIVARIVDNLLRNVERHACGATVRLTAEHAGDVVEIHVVDTGPGIPVQRSAEVFVPGVTTSEHGQGLGLPSARRLAQNEGGDLRLVSGDGGCHLVLTLAAAGARAPVTPLRAQAS